MFLRSIQILILASLVNGKSGLPRPQLLSRNSTSSVELSASSDPKCFTWTFAPLLKQCQCNPELEWFLEEERRYDFLELVGAATPYVYKRPRGPGNQLGRCFVSITADDPHATDQFTFGDVARFTNAVLLHCVDENYRFGRGGITNMTDAREEWGGFKLRVDAFNPYPTTVIEGNATEPDVYQDV